MGGMLSAMLAPFAHFNFALHELLIFAGIVINHLAGLATELY